MVDRDSSSEGALFSQLNQLIETIDASGLAVLPVSNDALLKSIVEAAARIFGAAAASILLVDEKENVLVFKVNYGSDDRDLVGMKVPLGSGIAGYVAMTGQPIAISNVLQDARFNKDFAQSTGYVPKSILATPLFSGERIMGVMEVLDKVDAPSFGMRDMDLIGIFAHQAAIAIDQSQGLDRLRDALILGLKRLAKRDDAPAPDELITALDRISQEKSGPALLALADLFGEISAAGDNELNACRQILQIFAGYKDSFHRSWS